MGDSISAEEWTAGKPKPAAITGMTASLLVPMKKVGSFGRNDLLQVRRVEIFFEL